MMKRCLGFSLALILFLTGCTTSASEGADATPTSSAVASTAATIVFGVFPYLPAAQIDETYGPLVRELGTVLGTTVRLRTTPSFETFSNALAAGDFDIAVVQPFDFPALYDGGYQPIARIDLPLIATIVAAPDRGLEQAGIVAITELRIGTPPLVSSIRKLLDAELIMAGFNPTTLDIRPFPTHADCLGQLRLGAIDVCAVAPLPLRLFESTTNESLSVVAVAEEVDSVAVVARPEFDPDQALRVQQFLLGLDDDPDLQYLLEPLEIPRYVPIEAGDYERIRELIAMQPSG